MNGFKMGFLTALKRQARPLKPFLRLVRSQYAGQYAEDALIFLTLKPSHQGFYVDVGAFHPIDGSNTYQLYRHGWRGLTIEPNPDISPAFRRWRAKDIHLTMGVASEPANLVYHRFDIGMLNTMDAERASLLKEEGYRVAGIQKVACEPLHKILETHAPGRQIDLLSVDCEGFDLDVLHSLDFERYRPTAILIEDLDGYARRRDGDKASATEDMLRARDYRPILHAAYSSLYVASDWRELNARSKAYDVTRIQPNLLPEPMANRLG